MFQQITKANVLAVLRSKSEPCTVLSLGNHFLIVKPAHERRLMDTLRKLVADGLVSFSDGPAPGLDPLIARLLRESIPRTTYVVAIKDQP